MPVGPENLRWVLFLADHHPRRPGRRAPMGRRWGTETRVKQVVMVVDDDEDIRESLKAFLEAAGFDVRLARNGQEALDRLLSESLPAVVLLDLRMPVMTGWELLAVMAENSRLRDVVVIVVSGSVGDAPLPAGIPFLPKPFEVGRLIATVRASARSC